MTYLLWFSIAAGIYVPWSATLYTRADCELAGMQLVNHMKRLKRRPNRVWCRIYGGE